MTPLSIAVQGIGFGALLVALQGIGPTTVTPTPPPAVSQNFTTREWVKVRKGEVKISARAEIPAVTAITEVAEVDATGAATIGVVRVSTHSALAEINAYGRATVKLNATPSQGKSGKILATGHVDMEDEDILSMLLTLLNS